MGMDHRSIGCGETMTGTEQLHLFKWREKLQQLLLQLMEKMKRAENGSVSFPNE
jgi:hypothetical protein